MASVRKRKWTHNGQTREAWVVAYTDSGGRRRIKTFEKKKDADKARADIEVDVGRGMHVPASQSATLARVADEYLGFMEGRHREQRGVGEAYLHSERCSAKVIVSRLGNVKMNVFSEKDVDALIGALLREGRSPKTIRSRLDALHRIVLFSMRRKYTGYDAVAPVIRERGRTEIKPIAVPSIEQVRQLLKTVDERGHSDRPLAHKRMRCFVYLGACCGLRRGEIEALQLSHVDFASRTIRIRHSLSPRGRIKSPKSRAGVRDVPLPDVVATMLQDWIATCFIPNQDNLLFAACSHATEYGSVSNVVSRGNFWHAWRKLLKRAALPYDGTEGFHFHSLRHFAASMMISYGRPVTEVAKLLGHSSFDLTLRVYAHPLDDMEDHVTASQAMVSELVGTQAGALISRPTRQERDKARLTA